MDSSTRVILKVEALQCAKVMIETSDGQRFYSDLTPLQKVFCFPKSQEAWNHVHIDSYGRAIIWPSRFEAHIDQIIAFAYKSEKASDRSA